MRFRNLDEIQQHFNNQLAVGNKSVLKNVRTRGKPLDTVLDETLKAAAEELREHIQYYINLYYLSYRPAYYVRTFDLQNALKVETQVHNDGGKRYIGLYFEEDKSWGESVFGGNMGYKPYLISKGWAVKVDAPFSQIEHWGFQSAYDFIEAGIIAWKTLGRYPNIEIERNERQLAF